EVEQGEGEPVERVLPRAAGVEPETGPGAGELDARRGERDGAVVEGASLGRRQRPGGDGLDERLADGLAGPGPERHRGLQAVELEFPGGGGADPPLADSEGGLRPEPLLV